jgi:trk system potassium uptake protein TrkH
VLWFEGALALALVGFAVARGLVLYHMFVPDSGDMAGRVAAAQTYDLVFAVLALLAGGLVVAPERTSRVLLHMAQRPAVLLAGSFAAMIAVGSLLLTLPLSVTDFAHVSYVDSLFTMASAVCVTGLTVNDVPTTYTLFGQATILAGIQLGGIGIMTIAALALAFGRNTSLQSQLRYAAMLDARTIADLRQIVVGIIAGRSSSRRAGRWRCGCCWPATRGSATTRRCGSRCSTRCRRSATRGSRCSRAT